MKLKLPCHYHFVSDRADSSCPQKNEHQQRGGQTLNNIKYPFEMGVTALLDENENPSEIGAATSVCRSGCMDRKKTAIKCNRTAGCGCMIFRMKNCQRLSATGIRYPSKIHTF